MCAGSLVSFPRKRESRGASNDSGSPLEPAPDSDRGPGRHRAGELHIALLFPLSALRVC
jgi:hypothetical protein